MLIPRSVFHLHEACDPDSSRYAIGGVLFTRAADGTPRAVATDGRRLIAARWSEPSADGFPALAGVDPSPNGGTFKAVLPKAFCRRAPKLADPKNLVRAKPILGCVVLDEHAEDKDGNGPAQVGFGATNLEESSSQTVRTIEGRFPRWTEIFPRLDYDAVTLALDAKLLADTLDTMLKVRGSDSILDNRAVRLRFRVECEEEEDESRECVNCGWITEKYWCERCSAKTEPRVSPTYKPVSSGVVLTMHPDEGHKEVCACVMPLNGDDKSAPPQWIPNSFDATPTKGDQTKVEGDSEANAESELPKVDPGFDYDAHLKIVADSWDRLRRVDVFRLVDACPEERRDGLLLFVRVNRPDLLEEAQAVVEDLRCPEGQPQDEPESEPEPVRIANVVNLDEDTTLTELTNGQWRIVQNVKNGTKYSVDYPSELKARLTLMRDQVEWEVQP